MKKNLNKLATLALTGAMVAGMSFGAMAAVTNGGVYTGVESNTIEFQKDLGVYNMTDGTAKVAVPNISYSYKLEGGAAGTKTVDNQSVEVKAGVGSIDGITTTFGGTKDQTDADADGVVSHDVTLNLSSLIGTGKIEEPGIYSYVLTETASLNSTADGYDYKDDVTETAEGNEKRGLLVYVGYADNGKDLKVLSAVMFKMSTTSSTTTYDEVTKTEGYLVKVNDETKKLDPTEIGNTESVYKTYDLTLKKQTYGNMIPTGQKFNFTVDLTTAPNGVTYATSNSDHSLTAVTNNASSTYTDGWGIGKDETIVIKSVPMDVTFKFTEELTKQGLTGYTTSNGTNETELTNLSAKSAYGTTGTVSAETVMGAKANTVNFLNIKDNLTLTGAGMRVLT